MFLKANEISEIYFYLNDTLFRCLFIEVLLTRRIFRQTYKSGKCSSSYYAFQGRRIEDQSIVIAA